MIASFIDFWKTSPHFRGASWKISSFICFSGINGIVRYLSQTAEAFGQVQLPAYEVAFFQNVFGLVFLLPWIIQNGPSSLITKSPLLQTSRICLSATGLVIWYYSLTQMHIAQAVALMFLSPLITTIGARIFLKENIGVERSIAILIGFVGGALITHTSFISGTFTYIALLPILAATCFSGATLMIRKLTIDDSPQLIVVYLLLFMAPILFVPTVYSGIWPEAWHWPWLFAMGALAAGAHLCLSKAYASAEVSYLIPYGFTKWFASALIGFAVFTEIPSFWTTTGAFTIMIAIIFLSYGEARRKRALHFHSMKYN